MLYILTACKLDPNNADPIFFSPMFGELGRQDILNVSKTFIACHAQNPTLDWRNVMVTKQLRPGRARVLVFHYLPALASSAVSNFVTSNEITSNRYFFE